MLSLQECIGLVEILIGDDLLPQQARTSLYSSSPFHSHIVWKINCATNQTTGAKPQFEFT